MEKRQGSLYPAQQYFWRQFVKACESYTIITAQLLFFFFFLSVTSCLHFHSDSLSMCGRIFPSGSHPFLCSAVVEMKTYWNLNDLLICERKAFLVISAEGLCFRIPRRVISVLSSSRSLVPSSPGPAALCRVTFCDVEAECSCFQCCPVCILKVKYYDWYAQEQEDGT